MRTFLATLFASLVASIFLWNFGVAAKIWPSHPLLATTILATVTGILVQKVLTWDAR